MDLCSASDATDSKKRCGEWVGTEQPSFDGKHQQSKVEIQARDVSSDIKFLFLPPSCPKL